MAFFVVLVRREKLPGQAPQRRSVTVEDGPYIRPLAAQFSATARRGRDDVRRLLPGVVKLEVLCFVVEARNAKQALKLGQSASLLWVTSTSAPWRSADSGGDGAGDRAPRPKPRGGLPRYEATMALPLNDGSSRTRFKDDVRAYPAEWDNQLSL